MQLAEKSGNAQAFSGGSVICWPETPRGDYAEIARVSIRLLRIVVLRRCFVISIGYCSCGSRKRISKSENLLANAARGSGLADLKNTIVNGAHPLLTCSSNDRDKKLLEHGPMGAMLPWFDWTSVRISK